ncbi:MAG TPA: response regulator, partial [Minicystis sp.]|nr:response regulator [Minicystis sp.]
QMPFVRALEARTTVVVDDIVIHRPDGGRVAIRAQARPVVDARGEITHVVIAFIDISREARAEEARAEAEARVARAERLEAVGQLAGGIAHDFNNVLAAVRLVASSLRHDEKDPARADALRQIEIAADGGTQLTRSLLAFAQRRSAAPTRASINEAAADVVKLMRLAVDRRIDMIADLRASSDVSGDRAQLEQIVMNLVVNAREAMRERGTVVVRTYEHELDADSAARLGIAAGPVVALEVEDDGPGIDPAIRDRIFEPYFTTKRGADRGRGLGLATVFGIVRSHAGAVEVASRAPHGTVMRVVLPRAANGPGVEPLTTAPAPTPGRGTILVIDDEPLVRKATSAALRHLGYDVIGAADGDEGVTLYRESRAAIRLVLLDMVMPRMDGHATLSALREIDPDVRVLLTTGNAADDGDPAAELGVAGLITKPYGLEELSAAIAGAIA